MLFNPAEEIWESWVFVLTNDLVNDRGRGPDMGGIIVSGGEFTKFTLDLLEERWPYIMWVSQSWYVPQFEEPKVYLRSLSILCFLNLCLNMVVCLKWWYLIYTIVTMQVCVIYRFRAEFESLKYRKRTAIKKEQQIKKSTVSIFLFFSFLIWLQGQVIKEVQKLERKRQKKATFFRVIW